MHDVASAIVRNSTKPNLASEPSVTSSTGSPESERSCRLAATTAELKNSLSISAVT